MNQTPIPVPSVDSRYMAATLEKCARIQARQLVQVTSIASAATLVAALLAGKLDSALLSNYMTLVLAVGPPCVASIFAAWCGNQDSVIALLDSFCRRLEEVGETSSGQTNLPRWYDPKQQWFGPSVIGRYWSHVAFGFALFAASMPGTLIMYMIGYKESAISAQIFIAIAVLVHRSFRIPVPNQRSFRIRRLAVTAVIVIAMMTMGLILSNVSAKDPVANLITHPHYILAVSTIVSIMPVSILIEFERRRIRCLTN